METFYYIWYVFIVIFLNGGFGIKKQRLGQVMAFVGSFVAVLGMIVYHAIKEDSVDIIDVVVGLFASLIASFLGKHYDAVLERAHRDPLTNVYNRYSVLEWFDETVQSVKQTSNIMACMMVDTDRLKHLNDTYGHDVGDTFIKLIASQLKNQVRNDDLVARWGGDEFLVLAICKHEEDVKLLRQRLEKAVNLCCPACNISLSASIGCAHTKSDFNLNRLIQNADIDMYKHKNMNRQVHAS